MAGSTELMADDRTHAIFSTGMVWVLFVLASLNEIATTDPGVTLVAPRAGEILVAVLIGLAVVVSDSSSTREPGSSAKLA